MKLDNNVLDKNATALLRTETEGAPEACDVMIDLETLGTAPGCVLLSLGAVKFSKERGIVDTFYCRISPESCQAMGLKVDISTVRWWMKQGEAARAEAFAEGQALIDMLFTFRTWLRDTGPDGEGNWGGIVWSNGASADLVWLAAAFRAIHVAVPWEYWNERCFRTVKALVDPDWKKATTHHALEDAKAQAMALLGWQAAVDAENARTAAVSKFKERVAEGGARQLAEMVLEKEAALVEAIREREMLQVEVRRLRREKEEVLGMLQLHQERATLNVPAEGPEVEELRMEAVGLAGVEQYVDPATEMSVEEWEATAGMATGPVS